MADMELQERRLLLSLAHPDDESFGMAGTVARYVSEGVDVTLICATDGAAGVADPRFLQGHDSMADLRLSELRCAAKTLGFKEIVTLNYRDSGMLGSPDNQHPDSLYAADMDEVAGRITEVLRRIRPQVVVTFDPYGGYGHPDHVAMHEATTRAFYAAGDPDAYAGQLVNGLEPYQPQKLYYMTFDRRLMKIMVRLMPLFGQNPRAMGRNKDIDYAEMAAHEYPIHARINTRAYAEQAEAARLCHASQLGAAGRPSIWSRLRRMLAGLYMDTYMRAYPAVNGSRMREDDLFAGVTPD